MSAEKGINDAKDKKIIKTRLSTKDNFLYLHTDIGQLLFNGHWKTKRMGIIQFAGVVSEIWKAHKADDPYADKCLIKISDAIGKTKEKLEQYEKMLHEQIDNLRGFKINLYNNPKPVGCEIKFSTPYPYMASSLVEHADYLVRLIYTLRRIGIMPDRNLTTSDLMREVRAVLRIPREWSYTGITREDIIQKNKKAREVEEKLGELPLAILNKEIESSFFMPRKLITQGDN